MLHLAIGALLLFAPTGQDPDFLAVREWWGTIDVQVVADAGGKTWNWKLQRDATLSFHLNRAGSGGPRPGDTDFSRAKDRRVWSFYRKRGDPPEPAPTMLLSSSEQRRSLTKSLIEGKAQGISYYERRHSSWSGSGRGTVDASTSLPRLGIDAKERRYWLELDASFRDHVLHKAAIGLHWRRDKSTTYDNGTASQSESEHGQSTAALLASEWPRIVIENQPLPGSIEPLTGSVTVRGKYATTEDAAIITFTWWLSPRPPEDIELVLEPQDKGEYDEWRPIAGPSETTPGNYLLVRARLQKRGGGVPETKARLIRGELRDVSAVPGICINYPPAPAPADDALAPEPDLKFDASQPSGTKYLGPSAVQREDKDLTEMAALINAFDYGAFGAFHARARLDDGRLIDGQLAGDPGHDALRVPKSADDSWIADAWKRDKKCQQEADDADDDDTPAGDGHKGDGLTLYEEYRGWYENGNRALDGEGDPHRKELFLCDVSALNNDEALRRYEEMTGLRLVKDLLETEIGPDQVINFNHLAAPHAVDQHGIRLVFNQGLPMDLQQLGLPPVLANATLGIALPIREGQVGRPGPPREKHIVQFRNAPRIFDFTAGKLQRTRTMLHELSHCLNVYHHGDATLVYWLAVKDPSGKWVIQEATQAGRRNIRVVDEDTGTDVTQTFARIQTPGVRQIVPLPLRGAQCSGDERCLMCYPPNDWLYFAAASGPDLRYVARGNEYVWFPLPELRLCSGPGAPEWTQPVDHRTHWNAPGHIPESHFGPATRGDCVHQLLVNDAVQEVPRR